MGHIYFIRHGQTDWNERGLICGTAQAQLTALGREQAAETARHIVERGIIADEILHSPLQRAADTAGYIARATGLPLRVEPRLIEQDYGEWEGRRVGTDEFIRAKCTFPDRYGSGESMLRLCQRIYNLLDELRAESENKTYILVAHNGVARAVHSYFNSMTNEEYGTYGIKNAEVVEYRFA